MKWSDLIIGGNIQIWVNWDKIDNPGKKGAVTGQDLQVLEEVKRVLKQLLPDNCFWIEKMYYSRPSKEKGYSISYLFRSGPHKDPDYTGIPRRTYGELAGAPVILITNSKIDEMWNAPRDHGQDRDFFWQDGRLWMGLVTAEDLQKRREQRMRDMMGMRGLMAMLGN